MELVLLEEQEQETGALRETGRDLVSYMGCRGSRWVGWVGIAGGLSTPRCSAINGRMWSSTLLFALNTSEMAVDLWPFCIVFFIVALAAYSSL